jgi:hypothetical protein
VSGAIGVIVLGMGRSGTSAVTGMFVGAGFFGGRDEDLMPATDANPGGHWENMGIWRANEQILDRLEGSWFDPPPIAVQRAARDWAVPILRAEFERLVEQADGAPVAIKDPRIGVMMPLWQEIVENLLHPVLVVRDPVEIARSLERRDGTPPAFSLAAWELHMAHLLDYLDGRSATVAPYGQLAEDGNRGQFVVEQAAAHLEGERASHVRPADAAGMLERGFRHNYAAAGDHAVRLTGRQLDLWQLLASLPAGEQTIDVSDALRSPSVAARTGVQNETERVQLILDLAAERARGAELEGELGRERQETAEVAARAAVERERAESASEALAGEQQRSAALSAEVAGERARADAATAAHLQAEAWLAAIQGSVSWRITEPLRAAKGWLPSRPRRRTPRDANRYEIHVPISPTPLFFTRIHYLAASVRRFGGALADSRIVVTVGGDERIDLAGINPWSQRLGVEWRWLDDALWRRHGIYATALQRFCYDIEAPNALLLDSDTLFTQPVDDLVVSLARSHAIAGVLAHVSPFIGCAGEQGLWEEIFHAAGLGDPVLECEHPGWQSIEFDPARRCCPPYFNLGVLFASREILGALAKTIYAEMETVERVHPTLFRCQIALTLAIVRSGVQWRQLPLRFNLPNIVEYLPRYQAELADVRIMHYLKDEQLTRAKDFASIESVGALLSRDDLNPFNARIQDTLRHVHENVLVGA